MVNQLNLRFKTFAFLSAAVVLSAAKIYPKK